MFGVFHISFIWCCDFYNSDLVLDILGFSGDIILKIQFFYWCLMDIRYVAGVLCLFVLFVLTIFMFLDIGYG